MSSHGHHARLLTFTPSGNSSGPAPVADDLLSRRTEIVLRELDRLPTLPAVASKLLELGARDDVQVRDIVKIIESDPALTTRLLSLCRRAAFRTRHPITTVEMAVVMLGVEAVRSLVLSVEIFDWAGKTSESTRREGAVPASTAKGRNSTRPGSTPAEPAPAFNRVGFWQHSISVACAADLIAREHPDLELVPEECFVCGLIHDMGKVALDLVLPRAYARVVELADSRRGNIADFERPIVGLDHHLAGRTLAEKWNLPPVLVAAMSLHHLPPSRLPEGPERRTLAVVHIADLMCRKLALGWSGNHTTDEDEARACTDAGLDPRRTLGIVSRLYEAASSRMRDLGLGDEPSQQLLLDSILRANHRLGRTNQDLIEANVRLEAAQRELSEARAMARLGQMTAGAAHEMNNPLAVISGRAQALLSRARDDADRGAARAIVEASTRLNDLIARLNRIATPPEVKPESLDVRALLEDAICTAKDRHGERQQSRGEKLSVCAVKLFVADGLELVHLDRALISDALIELIINALESTPRSRVEVRAEPENSLSDPLLIRVIDDGSGMSEKALLHATDPFFSEKPAGRQAGLGLALVNRLVSACGGEIDLASKPGRGTTATLRIPDWRIGAVSHAPPATRAA
jgi:signal transduction histidine kinase